MKDGNLPSLTSIRVFEAAAQHLSFVRAARQLGVQSPAVSRQVAELEQALGARLFVRSKPRLALTPQGQQLYLSVSHGLNEIRKGCEKLQDERREGVVKVVTSIGITSCWLLNRLVGFYQQYPEIELHLTTRDSTTNLDPADADVAILFGEDDLPGVEASCIFREKMITVCAPGLLAGHDRLSAEKLLTAPLLHYAEAAHRDDWQRLLATVDLSPPPPQRGMTFNSYVVYLQASLNGAGVAIGWEHLLDDYLDNGSLCRASGLELETTRGYFCCLTVNGSDNSAARQFRDWVCSLID
jgi:LysR family glycine cleavage system transcriptional activator